MWTNHLVKRPVHFLLVLKACKRKEKKLYRLISMRKVKENVPGHAIPYITPFVGLLLMVFNLGASFDSLSLYRDTLLEVWAVAVQSMNIMHSDTFAHGTCLCGRNLSLCPPGTLLLLNLWPLCLLCGIVSSSCRFVIFAAALSPEPIQLHVCVKLQSSKQLN